MIYCIETGSRGSKAGVLKERRGISKPHRAHNVPRVTVCAGTGIIGGIIADWIRIERVVKAVGMPHFVCCKRKIQCCWTQHHQPVVLSIFTKRELQDSHASSVNRQIQYDNYSVEARKIDIFEFVDP